MTPSALDRLFALSGVVPLGVYTLVHVAVYGSALFGGTSFGIATNSALSTALETALVWLPLGVHTLLGLRRTLEPLPEASSSPSPRQASLLLRLSGLVSLGFLTLHVYWLRAPLWRGERAPEDVAQTLAAELSSTSAGVPWLAAVHLVGLAAVGLHLGLGLARFLEQREWLPDAAARPVAWTLSALLFGSGCLTVIQLATGSALPRFLH